MMRALLVVSILLIGNAVAVAPPDQRIVDMYVDLAQKIDESKVRTVKGKIECSFVAIHTDKTLRARADIADKAVQLLQLVCIKRQCAKIGSLVQKSLDELTSLPEQEFRDLLEFAGKSQEEIEVALERRNSTVPSIESMTCETAPAEYRTFAFDSCFSVPVECRQK